MNRAILAEASVESADAELRRLRTANPGVVLQMASLKKLPTARAVRMIAEQTLRAGETGALLAEKPEVDLLLRLAGTAQIAVAIKSAGYQLPGRRVLVAAGPAQKVAALEEALRGDKRYRLVEGDELGAEGARMVERAALLSTRL